MKVVRTPITDPYNGMAVVCSIGLPRQRIKMGTRMVYDQLRDALVRYRGNRIVQMASGGRALLLAGSFRTLDHCPRCDRNMPHNAHECLEWSDEYKLPVGRRRFGAYHDVEPEWDSPLGGAHFADP